MTRALFFCFGILAVGTLAYAQLQSPAAGDTSGATKPKPAKVWTNDNMGDVTGTSSVVGAERPKPTPTVSKISSLQPAVSSGGSGKQAAPAKSSQDEVDPKTLAQVKQQVQKLQADIDHLDKQIDQLKGLSRGDSKNTGGLNADTWSYSTATIPDQIKSLEAKRSALQTSMDNLLDAARASGIEPGQLR